MKVIKAMQDVITQAEFAQAVGLSEAAVSQMMSAGHLDKGATAHAWLLAYCARLREQAAGRMDSAGGTDLAYERAMLARSQREGQDIKNAIARGAYAPIDLLSDVLANAAQSVVDRFDQIPATLRRVCPDLPPAAREAVMRELASARNEMVRKTESLMADALDAADQPVEDEPDSEAAALVADGAAPD